MAKTLWQLRREIGDKLDICAYGASDRGDSATLITDTDVLPIYPDRTWLKGWLYLPSTGARFLSVVQMFAAGVLEVSPAYSTNIPSGSAYEVWKRFKPTEVNDAINRFLTERATYLAQEYGTFVTDKYTGYALPTLCLRLNRIDYSRDADDIVPLTGYRVYGSPGALTFDVMEEAKSQVLSGVTLRFTYERYYPELGAEGSTTECPAAWLVSGVIADLYRMQLTRTQASDRDQIKENIGVYTAEAAYLARISRPPASRVRATPTRKVSH